MWNHVVVIVIGLWVMASPDVMGYNGPARTNHHIVGPLLVSFGMIALAESMRSTRWVNVGLGLWLVVAPFILSYHALHSSILGTAIVGLSLIEGTRTEKLGGGWPRLWKGSPDSTRPAREGSSVN
jgi:hypothetical protein